MNRTPLTYVPDWSGRWAQLSRTAGIAPGEHLLVALSGGADSVLLLHLIAASRPRPHCRAVFVDHGLRGAEDGADREFAARLCQTLGIDFVAHRLELDPAAPNLEARAREARYRALCAEARRSGFTTIVTGHHADDALETLLMRWIRGTHLGGLCGLQPRTAIPVRSPFDRGGSPADDPCAPLDPLNLVRPLLSLRREEVRRLLSDHGLDWCEDSTNQSDRFTRNRVRNRLLPTLTRIGGPAAVENLRNFGRAVEELESELAAATAHLAWKPPAYALASRPSGEARLGGSLQRAALMRLSPTLKRRALWRLIYEGAGEPPGRHLLELIAGDLTAGRCGRHTLPSRWTLILRSAELHLLPPDTPEAPALERVAAERQLPLPFPAEPEPAGIAGARRPGHLSPFALDSRPLIRLAVPGIVTLPDGRRISAEVLPLDPSEDLPAGPLEVELDAAELPDSLEIRWPRPGDRFLGLGAPGSKVLSRFLANAGIPREERRRVPLVCAGREILWVAGLRPGERRRVRSATTLRLRLALHNAAWTDAAWTELSRAPDPIAAARRSPA